MNIVCFAYGSNLDRAQMRARCPKARLLGVATLHGYRIVFSGHSRRWNGAVATLMPDSKARVQGLLYELTAADVARLDRFEGAPRTYRRASVRVWDEHGRRRRAHVYCLPEGAPRHPAPKYLLAVANACRRLGFDLDPLLHAIRVAKEVA